MVVGGAGELLGSRRRRRQEIERVEPRCSCRPAGVAVPSGVDFGAEGQPRWLTPNDEFYRIDTALSPPLIDPNKWELRIHGMVDREMTLTYQDLLDRGLKDAWITICCVSNPVGGDLIGNTTWSGVPIKDILEEVGVQPGADALLSTSEDGWTCGTPLDALMDGRDALLALTMNGEPLPVPHGFPVRQVVPGLYGYVSATKWVTDWEVTRFQDFQAYWTQRGWGPLGPIKTQARIDLPRVLPRPARSRLRGRVAAARRHQRGRGAGRRWSLAARRRWRRCPTSTPGFSGPGSGMPSTGDHTIEARATNRKGEPQTDEVRRRAARRCDGLPGHQRRRRPGTSAPSELYQRGGVLAGGARSSGRMTYDDAAAAPEPRLLELDARVDPPHRRVLGRRRVVGDDPAALR